MPPVNKIFKIISLYYGKNEFLNISTNNSDKQIIKLLINNELINTYNYIKIESTIDLKDIHNPKDPKILKKATTLDDFFKKICDYELEKDINQYIINLIQNNDIITNHYTKNFIKQIMIFY